MNNAEIVGLAHQNLMNTYGCLPVAFVRGEGAYLFDADGKRYLDFFCGLAVTSLGHAHPRVVNAIREQAGRLTHVSNVYHTAPNAELAARLCSLFGRSRVFFCNSGAEANETAIKLARRWGSQNGKGRFEILAAQGSFHGRTLATLSATGQEKYHQGFHPLVPGFRLVPFDDAEAMERAVGPDTIAIMLEPIQGEGGVVMPSPSYLRRVRELCDRKALLLILDEVQVGIGRTGRLFAHQHFDVRPDILTLAKALGGGLPIGATLAREEVAAVMTPGSHGSTFGGNPVASAAALAVLDALEHDGILENAARVGDYLLQGLGKIARGNTSVVEARGLGMIMGMELKQEAQPVVESCLKEGLLVNAAAGKVLRLLPPLNLTQEQARTGLAIVEGALSAAS
jgi:acetylornithine/N-succinyldiaminopimelate aminotransferase